MTSGFVGGVAWHPVQTEGKVTGGDFGLVIQQPLVQFGSRSIQIVRRKNRWGLLAQAKLKRSGEKWPSFTASQKRLLPGREEYLTLLGFEYSDKKNRQLSPFFWTLCRGHSFNDLKEHLASGRFPNKHDSGYVLRELAEGRIGTKDPGILDKIICPPASRHLIIWLDWGLDGPPSTQIETLSKLDLQEKQKIRMLNR